MVKSKNNFEKSVEEFANRVGNWGKEIGKDFEKKYSNKKNSMKIILSIIFISSGLFILLDNLEILTFNWSYLILSFGLLFLIDFVITKNYWNLFPGLLITSLGLMMVFNSFLPYLWNLAMGLSFISIYFYNNKAKWAKYLGIFLLILSFFDLVEFYTNISSWPIILILIGVYFLTRKDKK